MPPTDASPAPILVATDNVTDAALVKKQLEEEFTKVATSTDADAAAKDFERHRPDVLVLAFDNLEKAERYYLGLYRLCPTVQQHIHRTVILCNKDEVKRVYELCKKNYFDDYVLFWPMTYDMSRLAMAIHHALRELATLKDGAPSVAEFAAQARRLTDLEGLLEKRMSEGGQHLAVADQAMARAEQDIGAALDGFSRRLIDGRLPDAVTVNDADALQREIGSADSSARKSAISSAPRQQRRRQPRPGRTISARPTRHTGSRPVRWGRWPSVSSRPCWWPTTTNSSARSWPASLKPKTIT